MSEDEIMPEAAPSATPTAPAQDVPRARPLPAWVRRIFPAVQQVVDHEASRLLLSGVIVGIVGGVAAGAFDRAMMLVGIVFLGTAEPAAVAPVWWRALLGPTAMGLLAGLIIRYGTKRRRAQSVPDVMGRTQLHADTLSLREGLPSAVAAALVVGGGQSGGREGPIVQVASALASGVCRIVGVAPRHFRALVAAGAAAGVAASFNTPVGGAFFALEIILGDFALESFAPVVAATVTGTVVGQILLGDRVALKLPDFHHATPVELLMYLLLGLVSGVVAVVFKKMMLWGPHAVDRLGLPLPIRTAAAGLLVGAAAAAGVPQIMGNGYAWMELAITDPAKLGLGFLAVLLVVKPIATTITAAGKGGAGLFAPSLYIGAVTGLAFGLVAQWAFPHVVRSPGAYGMVGMGAVCAAVLHAPITMALMLFEMTGNYKVILPLLLSLATSGFVSAMLGSESIYESELKRQGLPAVRRKTNTVLAGVRVADVMRAGGYEVVEDDAPLADLLERFMARRLDAVWVVDGAGRLDGLVELQDVKELLLRPKEGMVARDVVVRDVPRLHADEPLADTVPLFFRSAKEELPVVDADEKLIGILAERDVVAAYHREVARKDQLVARVDSGRPGDRHTDYVELPEGEALEVVEVDDAMGGRTLRELELPKKTGCTVLAMSRWNPRKGRWEREAVTAETRLDKGDRLVVVGPNDRVAAMVVR